MNLLRCFLILSLTALASNGSALSNNGVSVELTPVLSKTLEKEITLPAELQPYQRVTIYAKISGFVEAIPVDRGSWVKNGQLLATLSAPEMEAELAEARARAEAIESQRAEVEARIAAAKSTYEKLKAAAQTPGAVAGNDLVVAEKRLEAELAQLEALEKSTQAAQAAALALEELGAYLKIEAPFSGIVTTRYAHVGSLVGPSAERGLLELEQISPLRLVVAVPERYTAAVPVGTKVRFDVPAFPGTVFEGIIRRVARSLDIETRTMPVELDVDNSSGKLSPGMFASAAWPVRRPSATLFVPPSAVVQTTERIFVIRVRDNLTEWVDVRRGDSADGLVEIFGDLKQGDLVVLRGTDEIRPGTRIKTK